MANKMWNVCKQVLRSVRKCIKWLFLLALPLMAMPVLIGISNGFYFAFWYDRTIDTNSDIWIHAVKDLSNDWGVPGMTFRDFRDKKNAFQVLRLNFDDWASKLGFIQPLEYAEIPDTPIDKFGDLETLMLDTNPLCGPPPPKEQWVYLTDWAWPDFDDWDAAFDAAVQAAYVPSALNKTRLFYAQCGGTEGTAAFLCGVWGIRPPSLLHFSIEDSAPQPDDIEPGVTYSASISNLRAVSVRVIEFPLKDTYTALPSSVFPGPTEQMLAMMRGGKLWEQIELWNGFQQALNRFNEYMDDNFYDRKETFLYRLGKMDHWTTDHVHKLLGLEEVAQIIYQIVFLANFALINGLILKPWHFLRGSLLDFVGYPKPGDWVLGDGSKKEWNIWDDLIGMSNAADQLLENLQMSTDLEKGYTGGESQARTKPPQW